MHVPNFVAYLLIFLLSCPESETATTAFTTKPPNPTIAEEGTSFTLEWTYTLDGTVVIAQFYNTSGGGSVIFAKAIGTGNVSAEAEYQGRVSGHVTNTKAELTIMGMQRSELLTCRFALTPTGAGSLTSIVEISIHYSSSITGLSVKTDIIEGGNVTLECSAVGNPEPNITWTRLPDNSDVTMPLTNISRHDAGMFRCTADNGVGRPATGDLFVVVQYRPEGNGSGQNATVAGGFEHTFSCPVDGNPVPNITWYNEIGAIYSGKQFKTSQSGCYICVARNIHGISGNITQCLIINSSLPTVPPTTDSSQTMVSSITVPPRQEIRAILTILTIYEPAFKDLNSSSSKEFVAKFEQQMDKIYWNMPEYIRTEVTKLRPGNVIVYFILYFKTALTPEEGIENLRIAISSNGTFGDFQAKDLHLISEQSTKPTTPKGSSSASTTVPKAGPPWIIIIAVAGGVVLLAILVGVSTWWVHKQRKCRKGTKVHNSGLGRHDDEEGYSQVQGAYAHSGPPAANGADGAAEQEIGAARAIPTYAVVDKSKKSKEQADEKPPEYAVVDKTQKKEKQEVAAISTYAAVDKSKKKKKSREEVPAVYAEVDKSKKKKKKKVDDKNLYEDLDEPKKEKKPGELLYADLGDFQNPSMPTVSTSPQPLPAIKKADPYERTDYADITQFLKGNATLPPNDGNGDTEMKPKRPSKNTIQGNDKETPI